MDLKNTEEMISQKNLFLVLCQLTHAHNKRRPPANTTLLWISQPFRAIALLATRSAHTNTQRNGNKIALLLKNIQFSLIVFVFAHEWFNVSALQHNDSLETEKMVPRETHFKLASNQKKGNLVSGTHMHSVDLQMISL